MNADRRLSAASGGPAPTDDERTEDVLATPRSLRGDGRRCDVVLSLHSVSLTGEQNGSYACRQPWAADRCRVFEVVRSAAIATIAVTSGTSQIHGFASSATT